jgi:hypothetical protein
MRQVKQDDVDHLREHAMVRRLANLVAAASSAGRCIDRESFWALWAIPVTPVGVDTGWARILRVAHGILRSRDVAGLADRP